MKKFSWGALAIIALGVIIALTPYTLFPVCRTAAITASDATAPMKCFWVARATLGNAGGVVFCGVVFLFVSTPGVRLGAALMLLFTGLLTALTPNALIGVCPGESMPCRIGTLPALSLLGLLTSFAAACIAVRAGKRMKPGACGAYRREFPHPESGL